VIPEKTTHLIILRLELADSLGLLFRGYLAKLRRIEANTETLMALTQETRDLLVRLDAATTAVAARIETAIVKIQELELEAADEAEIVGILQPTVATLEGLAHNPENPVPGTR